MERTVVPSFSSIGYSVRRRLDNWQPISRYHLRGKVIVLTGGTSGIGEAAAELYAELGATLIIIARNQQKTEPLIEQLRERTRNKAVRALYGDLGIRDDVQRIANELALQYPVINVLVHNAGALFNQRKRAANGTDLSVELMVATPFLLTGLLLPQLGLNENISGQHNENSQQTKRFGPGRVLTMSSGGMYTQALTVNALEMRDNNYHGAKQYARAKRAQVVLNEMWASRIPASDIVFHALHPGWVKTPGITEALPLFSKMLDPLGLLRSPKEGADTLLWLSAAIEPGKSTGLFWHDRATRSINMSQSSRNADTPEKRAALWQWCETHTNWQF